jgi:hypothetical protein
MSIRGGQGGNDLRRFHEQDPPVVSGRMVLKMNFKVKCWGGAVVQQRKRLASLNASLCFLLWWSWRELNPRPLECHSVHIRITQIHWQYYYPLKILT